jgi:hypothetical protein
MKDFWVGFACGATMMLGFAVVFVSNLIDKLNGN